MLRTTKTQTTATTPISPRALLAVLLPVLVLVLALAPASAMAGTGSGSSADCTATVDADADNVSRASFDVNCSEGNDILSVVVRTNEGNPGSIVEEDEGTDCDEAQQSRDFTCSNSPEDGSVGAVFELAQDGADVCADPRLEIDFEVTFSDSSTSMQDVNDVVVAGCDDRGGAGSGGDEDNGSTPEGGVDSGRGPAVDAAGPAGTAVPIVAASMIALALAGGLVLRRARSAR